MKLSFDEEQSGKGERGAQDFGSLLAAFSFFATIATLLGFLGVMNSNGDPFASTLTIVTATIALTLLLLLGLRVFTRVIARPFTMRIAVVGPKRSGKTTFLTVLYRELTISSDPNVKFMPYGTDTIEAVHRNLDRLGKGSWPLPTSPGSLFPFRARATVETFLFPKHFVLETGDYAGEHMDELLPEEEAFLHKTEYFQYVLDADAIFFVLDGSRVIQNGQSCQEAVDQVMVAIQVYLSATGKGPGRMSQIPVALLVTKNDLFDVAFEERDQDFSAVFAKIEAIQRLMRNNFKRSRTFFVSSTGPVSESGKPPYVLEPFNVTDPLKWILLTQVNLDLGPKPSRIVRSRTEKKH